MITDPNILKRLANVREVPTLPEVMRKAMATLASENSSAGDLAEILSNDQALCAKALRVANSAFFAQSRRIYDIRDAVVLLGFDYIAQITLAASVLSAFGPIYTSEKFDVVAFWEHSVATAHACEIIAETHGDLKMERILYTAGLLHDVGKLLLLTSFSDEYRAVLEKAESEDLFLHEAEQRILGFTHCEIGEWVCNRWNFPERLVGAIARHHAGAETDSDEDIGAAVVGLANVICNRLQFGNSGNRKAYEIEPEICASLKLGQSDIAEMEKKLEGSRSEIKALIRAFR